MKIFAKLAFGASLLLGAVGTSASAADLSVPSGAYKVDPNHASVTWKVSHFGLSFYNARFTKFDIKIDLDADDIEKSSVTATINVSSVKTDHSGGSGFDKEISKDKNFLNGKKFPKIKFVSKSIEKTGETTALIHGTVTMLGISKDMTLEATLIGFLPSHPYAKKPAIGLNATGSIKRSDFGFTHLVPFIGDEVVFNIDAEFIKAG
ncbi:MAG: polyisoprenoid-binding protein [Kordiimonadaceae bacterium]|nr:polyisoprenoid-binding protein [Kordiimonadaceae bacterium]